MNTMKKLVTAVIISSLLTLNLNSDEPEPPPLWGVVFVVGCAALAGGLVYVIAKKSEPKYYWLMDKEQPPTFWVGAATKKECQINGWIRIGGPYNRPQDAPATHPDPTNRVQNVVGPPVKITTESLINGQWQAVDIQVCDFEDHVYWPTNAVSGMFRFQVGAP